MEICPHCKLDGYSAVRGEQLTAHLPVTSIDRHPRCGHVIAYRSGGRRVDEPMPMVTLRERQEYVRMWRQYVASVRSGRT